MRWKLKTAIVLMTLLCVVFARWGYLHGKYNDLLGAGGQLYYEWQKPTVEKQSFTFHRLIENTPTPTNMLQQSFSVAPTQQTWLQKISSATVSNEPIAIQIDAPSISDELIETMAKMPKLETMLLTKASNVTDPVEPGLQQLLDKLTETLPDVEIYLESQLDSADVADE